MYEPIWKRLVEQLDQRDFESPYLDRLRSRLPSTGDFRGDITREILQEMASALGRSEDKVNASLLRLDVLARDLDALAAEERRDARWRRRHNALVDEFNAERERARTWLWELRVHREAVGFRRVALDDGLAEIYPIPPPRDRLH